MQTAIQVQNLTVKIGDHKILDNISFDINQGEIVYILGSNGSGKTTLIKTILGLINCEQGEINIFGKVNSQLTVSQYCGYLPQYTLIDRTFPITVKEMIELECDVAKSCIHGAEKHLHFLNSEHLKNRKLNNLSGGEFQRALIARALVTDPRILIFDEPYSNLDHKTQEDLNLLIKDLNKRQGKTIFIITHDHNIIDKQSDKVIYIINGKCYSGNAKEIIEKYHKYT